MSRIWKTTGLRIVANPIFEVPGANDYPGGAPTSAREGTRPANGPPGSDLELVQRQVLDPWDVEVGILTCGYWVQSVHNEDLAASLATAVNQWQIDHWLEKDARLRASLVVPSQNPVLAAREIERFGDHPGFVQVILPVRSYSLYGKSEYNPMYAAAVKHDLAIGIHFGGASSLPPTPVGWPSTYIEECADMAQIFQAQVLSLISEGAFCAVSRIAGGVNRKWICVDARLDVAHGQGVERSAPRHPLGCAPPIGLRARTHSNDATTDGRTHKFRTPVANDWATGLRRDTDVFDRLSALAF